MKKIFLLTMALMIVLFAYSADINVNGYILNQYDSYQTFTFPDTTIPEGYYVIVARNADQASFEAFWGVTLGANVIYFNGSTSVPQINGAETYSLKNSGGTMIDSTTQALSAGNTAQRDSTNVNTWTMSAEANADPGSGVTTNHNAGLVITEYSDASGTGNYIYEYVEIYNDGAGAPGNFPPSINSLTHNPDPLHEGEDFSVVANITDDSGVFSDSLIGRLNGGAWNVWTNDSIVGDNYYYTDIGTFNEGDVIDYFVKALDDSNALSISDTNTLTVQSGSATPKDSIDITGYVLYQYVSSYTINLPSVYIHDGDYLVIGRNADQAAFEAFWGVTLGANVVYFNAANGFSINGAETYSLYDNTPAIIDTANTDLVAGNTAQRDATNATTWTQSTDTLNANPGSGVTGGNSAGVVITEFSDASGTGNYIYEFVEIFYDASGTAANPSPVIDDVTTVPFPIEPGDDADLVAVMHDDSGIFADTCMLKIGEAGSWSGIMKDSLIGDSFCYSLGTFNEDDTIFVYMIAIDDSNNVSVSDTYSMAIEYHYPEMLNFVQSPDPVYNGIYVSLNLDITDNEGISTARMVYWVNGASPDSAAADSVNGDTYHYHFDSFNENDTVTYYYYATDTDAHTSYSDTFGFRVIAAPSFDIKINEFCANGPSVGDTPSEWIELYNTGSSTVDISNYSVSDGEGTFTIPAATTLDAGDFFVCMHTLDSFNAYYTLPGGVGYFEYGPTAGSFGLGNSGDDISLYNASAALIDFVNYATGVNAAPNPGDSLSATRFPDGKDTDVNSDDFIIPLMPTPGAAYLVSTGPSIANLERDIIFPSSTEKDTITCNVSDSDGVLFVYLVTSAYDSTDIDTYAMNNIIGDSYSVTLPSRGDGCKFEYFAYAVDSVNDTAWSADTGRFFWGVTPIATFKKPNSIGFPSYYGYQVRAAGIVTTPTYTYGTTSNIINFQQNYISGAVVRIDSIIPSQIVTSGDSIIAEGTVTFWNGQERLGDPYAGLTIISSGHYMDTIYLTEDDLIDTVGENYEGLLIQIYTNGIKSGTWPSGTTADLVMWGDTLASKAKGAIVDTFMMRVDNDLVVSEPASWNRRITGILSQYDISSPYFSGYQLYPRDSFDVYEGTPVAINNFFLTLNVVNGMVVLNWDISGMDDIAYFRVERRETDSSEYSVLKTMDSSYRTFTDNVSLDKSYEYRVVGISISGRTIEFKPVRIKDNMLIKDFSISIENNLVNSSTWINMLSPRSGNATIQLFDKTGRMVDEIVNGTVNAGRTNVYLNLSKVPSGIYFVKAAFNNEESIIKINLVK